MEGGARGVADGATVVAVGRGARRVLLAQEHEVVRLVHRAGYRLRHHLFTVDIDLAHRGGREKNSARGCRRLRVSDYKPNRAKGQWILGQFAMKKGASLWETGVALHF